MGRPYIPRKQLNELIAANKPPIVPEDAIRLMVEEGVSVPSARPLSTDSDAPQRPSRATLSSSSDQSFAALLSRLYNQCVELLDAIDSSDDLGEKADLIAKLAKILPLLHSAESNHTVKSIDDKAIEDLSDEELARLATRILRSK